MKTIECPNCGCENDFDATREDAILCDQCGVIIAIPESMYEDA